MLIEKDLFVPVTSTPALVVSISDEHGPAQRSPEGTHGVLVLEGEGGEVSHVEVLLVDRGGKALVQKADGTPQPSAVRLLRVKRTTFRPAEAGEELLPPTAPQQPRGCR